MANNMIQFRADEDLKLQASVICGKIGIDIPSYLRMCLARMVSENGIPFSMCVNEPDNIGIAAMRKAQRIAERRGISDMSLDEINAEIAKARK
ncbi:MAG: type II toxin-antitoxin system RelB/DinJ family antitoxin [Clostridiales bacterium]|nr:type II toxin-antitoxin system RelB/DinJ family antitoxin [Clostridiales bacterium]